MRVYVIRHGKVLHDWKKWCTSAEFDEQCALYDKAPIDKASVVTHGFFMHTLIRIMKNVGFKADKERVIYSNGEVILLTRNY